MFQPAPLHSYSFAEYLALEATSNVKHEYLNGEIYAMAGGTPAHAARSAAILAAIVPQLRHGPCRIYSSDLPVRVSATGLATYPDAVVVCGPLELDPESATTVLNPKAIVEVLSDSTAAYDRGVKLDHYKRIESLEVVLLFSQTSRRVEVHRRSDGGWSTEVVAGDHRVALRCVDAELSLAAVYTDAGL